MKGMNILVCVKQVPDSADTITISEDSSRIVYDKGTVFRLNRYDEFAIEEALRIKEHFSGSRVDAVSVGPGRVIQAVRKAMETGVDYGIHIRVETEEYLSPSARASLIAHYACTKGYDLVLTGIMAEDDMECQVGQILSEKLSYSCATAVMVQRIAEDEKSIYVEREIEGGVRECITLAMPAVLTVQSRINTPRYPSLSNVLRARNQEIEVIEPHGTDVIFADQSIVGLGYPEDAATGEFLKGSSSDKAGTLLGILHELSIV